MDGEPGRAGPGRCVKVAELLSETDALHPSAHLGRDVRARGSAAAAV